MAAKNESLLDFSKMDVSILTESCRDFPGMGGVEFFIKRALVSKAIDMHNNINKPELTDDWWLLQHFLIDYEIKLWESLNNIFFQVN